MAFSLQKFRAYGTLIAGPARNQAIQYAELHIGALAADVDLDIGDDDGTFWTDALADADYGDVATAALAALQEIAGAVSGLVHVGCEQLMDRTQVLIGDIDADTYVVDIEDHRPNITFDADDGEEALVIRLEWALKDGKQPTRADYGAAV